MIVDQVRKEIEELRKYLLSGIPVLKKRAALIVSDREFASVVLALESSIPVFLAAEAGALEAALKSGLLCAGVTANSIDLATLQQLNIGSGALVIVASASLFNSRIDLFSSSDCISHFRSTEHVCQPQ